MGTGQTVPGWVADIQIMETFGWTERELYEEVSLGTVERIRFYLQQRGKAEEQREREARAKAARSR